MIAHVVTFTWKSDVTEEQVSAVLQAHRRLAEIMRGTADVQFGSNLALLQNTADYAVVVIADDVDAISEYLDHPDHVALVEQHTSKMLMSRNAVQIHWSGNAPTQRDLP